MAAKVAYKKIETVDLDMWPWLFGSQATERMTFGLFEVLRSFK